MSQSTGQQAETLSAPVDALPGVGPRRAALFRRMGLGTVGRLLRHYPARYEREEAETSIGTLAADAVVSARGEVTATRTVLRGRQRFEAVLSDGTGRLDLVWFNGAYLRERIGPGVRLRVQGKARRHGPGLQLVNPRWEEIKPEREEPVARSGRLRPVYPATEDLTSREIEAAVAAALPGVLAQVRDHLPDEHRREREMPTLAEALRMIHAPASEEEVGAARRRLAYDELFVQQVAVALKREARRRATRAPALRWTKEIDAAIRARLPFALTPGQESAVTEIVADLTTHTPANRLIQGDVGSGKTAVALYAMLLSAASRRQSALLAPTEILAEQHHASIAALLRGSNVRIGLLTGGLSASEREAALAGAASGETDILIGTHALLGGGVRFRDLAVAVIDEQHRFGVRQRAALRAKADDPDAEPHVLVMTATPIPRTLSLTIFGDLDVSVIRGLPPGRMPSTTRVVTPEKSDEVYRYVRTRLERGEQAYIVAPTIDAEDDGAAGVLALLRRLEGGELQGLRLAAMHGRLKRETRERVMERFRAGTVRALVATTVIEVGVDVPNASVMVVEQAERFGLSQLHQLRGRVGRGSSRGLCVLIGAASTEESAARLRAMAETTDGFTLAERDLELRGPGEVLGARQAGDAPFQMAEFPRDTDLLLMARRDARAWVERSPDLSREEDRLLRARVQRAHGSDIGLSDVA